MLRLEQERQTFTLTEVAEKAVLSVLRGFSAPVKLEVAGRSDGDLSFLLAHDSDSFSRWDAGQSLQTALLLRLYAAAADPSKVCGTAVYRALDWPLSPRKAARRLQRIALAEYRQSVRKKVETSNVVDHPSCMVPDLFQHRSKS